jgi:hypothetical protein
MRNFELTTHKQDGRSLECERSGLCDRLPAGQTVLAFAPLDSLLAQVRDEGLIGAHDDATAS